MSQQQQQQIQIQQQYPHITDVSVDSSTKETYIKAFLMDDTVNKNYWHVPDKVMKKYATSFIGRPWIVHPSGDHPNYIKEGVLHDSPTFIEDILEVQNRYKGGDIIDVTHENIKEDPSKKGWYVTIKVTNPAAIERLKSGSISPYVSPQIYDLSKAMPGEPTTEFIPLHIATVDEPAYGNVARVKASCNGSGPACITALKSAALQVVSAIDNSSFLKKLNTSNNTTLANNNNIYDPNESQPQTVTNGYIPNYQTSAAGTIPTPNPTGQLINQKSIVQELDANGNVVTRTEDKKPKTGTGVASSTNRQTIIAPEQSVQTVPPQATQVPTNPEAQIATQNPQQVPNEMLEVIKNLQASLTGMGDRLNQIENFKKSAEDEKIKKASEAQRKVIEGVFTPEIIADEQARQDIIEKFVGLPLSDDDLNWVLNLVVTGKFSTSGGEGPEDKPKEASRKTTTPATGLKQASLNLSRLVMTNVPDYDTATASAPQSFQKRFFSDVDASNI